MKLNKNIPATHSQEVGWVQHMSPAAKQEVIDKAFHANGGQVGYNAWAKSNPDDYYNKHFLRNVPRPTAIEHTAASSVEDLLERLDRAANAKTIDGEYRDASDE